MAVIDARPAHGRLRMTWDTALALTLGPLLLFIEDVADTVAAQVPLQGVIGSPWVILSGLMSSGILYLTVFLLLRVVLELPRLALSAIVGRSLPLPHLAVGAVTVVLLLWLNL